MLPIFGVVVLLQLNFCYSQNSQACHSRSFLVSLRNSFPLKSAREEVRRDPMAPLTITARQWVVATSRRIHLVVRQKNISCQVVQQEIHESPTNKYLPPPFVLIFSTYWAFDSRIRSILNQPESAISTIGWHSLTSNLNIMLHCSKSNQAFSHGAWVRELVVCWVFRRFFWKNHVAPEGLQRIFESCLPHSEKDAGAWDSDRGTDICLEGRKGSKWNAACQKQKLCIV